jgi:hypothetical protein
MSALARTSRLELYQERLSAFHEIEDFMGEMAELLGHVADALSHIPNEIDLCADVGANLQGLSLEDQHWPSFAQLKALQKSWRIAHALLDRAWNDLSEDERASAAALPAIGANNP